MPLIPCSLMIQDTPWEKPRNFGLADLWSLINFTLTVSIGVTVKIASVTPAPSPQISLKLNQKHTIIVSLLFYLIIAMVFLIQRDGISRVRIFFPFQLKQTQNLSARVNWLLYKNNKYGIIKIGWTSSEFGKRFLIANFIPLVWSPHLLRKQYFVCTKIWLSMTEYLDFWRYWLLAVPEQYNQNLVILQSTLVQSCVIKFWQHLQIMLKLDVIRVFLSYTDLT